MAKMARCSNLFCRSSSRVKEKPLIEEWIFCGVLPVDPRVAANALHPKAGGVEPCPLLAQSGHSLVHCTCPLSGVKRTWVSAVHMSAFDPKRTSSLNEPRLSRYDALARLGGDRIFL